MQSKVASIRTTDYYGSDRNRTPGYGMSRGGFLKIGGAALAGVALLGEVARPAFAATVEGDVISAQEAGIKPSNDGITNRENLVKALRYTTRHITFPPGDYTIDNSRKSPERGLNGGYSINIDYFEGTLTMEDGARFVFTDPERGGLNFHGGTGAVFEGLSGGLSSEPSTRSDTGTIFYFEYTQGTILEGVEVSGSCGAGVLFWHCMEPEVRDGLISDTLADGLHFANCQEGRVDGLRTQNTGDDGLAYVNYEDSRPYSGGEAKNIEVRDSKARGIAVVGQSDVTIEDFLVDGTNCDGIYCCQENSYRTRVPSNVLFRAGEINRAGHAVDPAGKVGTKTGIASTNVGSVEFRDIQIDSPKTRGVATSARAFKRLTSGGEYVSESAGTVKLTNIEVRNAPSNAFSLEGGNYVLDNLFVKEAGGIGFYAGAADSLTYGTICVSNASLTDDSGHARRAVVIEQNDRVAGERIFICDDQASSTGYKLVTYGNQNGNIGTVYDHVSRRDIEVQNMSDLRMSKGDSTTAAPISPFSAGSPVNTPDEPASDESKTRDAARRAAARRAAARRRRRRR